MHDDQDYTVIIKWKNWFALEDEEMDIPLERKRKHSCDMIILDDQDAEDRPELKRMRVSDATLADKKLSATSSSICITDDNEELLGGQQKNMNHNAEKQNELALNDKSPFVHDVKPSCRIITSKVTNKEVAREPKSLTSKSPNQLAPFGSEGVKYASVGLESTCRQAPHELVTSQRSAHEVHDTSSDDEAGATCSKSPMVEEGQDAAVTVNGKAKMSNIRSIYKKSTELNTVVKSTNDIENGQLVEHERPAKRMRETTSATSAQGGAVVECPICQVKIPGDLNDADFITQINLHVDSCIQASM